MEPIYLDAALEEKTSEKKGTKYYVVTISLTDSVKKQVFLEPAEVELIKLVYSKGK